MEQPLATKLKRCVNCKHFIFRDPDLNYCLNCGKTFPPFLNNDEIVVDIDDVQKESLWKKIILYPIRFWKKEN